LTFKANCAIVKPAFFGKSTSIIVHNNQALTGIRSGARNNITVGAWVEVDGFYSEKENTLDTDAIRWDGRHGQIEIMQYNIKSPRD